RGPAEDALLLDGGRFGVALDDDQPLEHGPVLAGDFLPGRLAFVLAEPDDPPRVAFGQEDAPAVLLHRDVREVGPAVAADGDGSAQIHVLGRQGGAEVAPPVQEAGLPALQGPLQAPVACQTHVVGDAFAVVDRHGHAGPSLRCAKPPGLRPCAAALLTFYTCFAEEPIHCRTSSSTTILQIFMFGGTGAAAM